MRSSISGRKRESESLDEEECSKDEGDIMVDVGNESYGLLSLVMAS